MSCSNCGCLLSAAGKSWLSPHMFLPSYRSSILFASLTEGLALSPRLLQALRALVPRLIAVHELHFMPNQATKSFGQQRSKKRIANLAWIMTHICCFRRLCSLGAQILKGSAGPCSWNAHLAQICGTRCRTDTRAHPGHGHELCILQLQRKILTSQTPSQQPCATRLLETYVKAAYNQKGRFDSTCWDGMPSC